MAIQIPDMTPDRVKQARTVDLVAFYNRKTGSNILKFADRATAERRCLEIIANGKPAVKPPKNTRKFDPTMEGKGAERAAQPKPQRVDPKKAHAAIRRTMAEIPSAMEMLARTVTSEKKPRASDASADPHRRRGPAPKYPLDSKLEVRVENPKRPGTTAYEEFEIYKVAKTVGDYVKFGGQLAYMNYDIKRGFVKVHPPVAAKSAKAA